MVKIGFFDKIHVVVASTFSNSSLSELHMKYFSRTSFRLQHSSRICLTVREHLHSSQSGWLSPESRYLWVTHVWPMRSLLRIAGWQQLDFLIITNGKERSYTRCDWLWMVKERSVDDMLLDEHSRSWSFIWLPLTVFLFFSPAESPHRFEPPYMLGMLSRVIPSIDGPLLRSRA